MGVSVDSAICNAAVVARVGVQLRQVVLLVRVLIRGLALVQVQDQAAALVDFRVYVPV